MPRYESLPEYAEALRRRGEGVVMALRIAAKEAAGKLTEESIATLQREVYDIPEKRGPTGRKLWVRTHTLIDTEKFTVDRATGTQTIHRNYTPYMIHRYRYDTPQGRPAIPPQRRSHWFTDTIRRNAWWIRKRQQYWLRQLLEGKLG